VLFLKLNSGQCTDVYDTEAPDSQHTQSSTTVIGMVTEAIA